MRNKILNTFKNKGFVGFFVACINFVLHRLFKVEIVGKNIISKNPIARKIFSRCNLEYSDEGYFFLNPMPSKKELDEYYSSVYWNSRAKIKSVISIRDLIHFYILKKLIDKDKVFINIGSAYGNISHLCFLMGMKIINIEPSPIPNFYDDNENWRTVTDISEVKDCSADIVYGSHSLEHVQDIEFFKKQIGKVLKPKGHVFWEVPNADCEDNGPLLNKIIIPHTYYFQTKFFKKWFKNTILLDEFEHTSHTFDIQNWQKNQKKGGIVIRALGTLD